jgi:hypothetical protein
MRTIPPRPFRAVTVESDVQEGREQVRVTIVAQLPGEQPYVAGRLTFQSEDDADTFIGLLQGQVGPSVRSIQDGELAAELENYVGHLA